MSDPDILVVGNKHAKLHEVHQGHEEMHLKMFLVAIVSLFGCQALLMTWKRCHPSSYQIVTLFAMWLIPFLYSISSRFPRFVIIWVLYTIVTGTMVHLASRKKISTTTPRRVYRWFLFLHNMTYAIGIAGYIFLMLTFFQVNTLIVSPRAAIDGSLLAIFYGLYFGVISRDFAEFCTDKIAARIGYHVPNGMPVRRLNPNVCSLCLHPLEIGPGHETAHRLNCSHSFHDYCIRGWCIVGKKDTCPYCNEKVNLHQTFRGPWLKPQIFYGSLLDWIRYLVAWQPLILLAIQTINTLLGLK